MCGGSGKSVRPQITRNHPMNDSSSGVLHYDRSAILQIRMEDDHHKLIVDDRLSVQLTEPAHAFSLKYSASNREVWGSGCVLPGLDPRGGFKACQDLVFVETFEGVLLAGEFDGHGVEGESVVQYCKRFALPYLKNNIQLAKNDPEGFLINLNEECDRNLKKAVDCKASGCTAVMILYVSGHMYFSCVGDSRAILATTAPHKGFAQPPRREDKQLLEEIKEKRIVTPGQVLTAEQVTQDQKPEDPGELKRITKAGGLVMRLEDENGHKVGPYRVWKVEGMYPGIAMSRSLGDVIAQEIGVISTPVITHHEVSVEHDYFLLLGSDGVWDMMENQEVCDFVEAFRHKSVRDVTLPKFAEVVEPGKVTIAQLLCEEARARWLSIVEAEDVLIDDISCIVLELQIHGDRQRAAPRRVTGAPRDKTQDVPGLEQGIRRAKTKNVDVRRLSAVEMDGEEGGTGVPEALIAAQSQMKAKQPTAMVKDPRRSSISIAPPFQ